MNLFDYVPPPAPEPAMGNLPPYTVAELSQAVKRTVESAFGLVRVRGEVAQPKLANTGHLYFSLKDADAVLDAVAWKGTVSRLPLRVEHGMDVICTGRLTTYAKSSRYQLVIESIELAGEGAILKLLEDRKRRLAAEGLFDPVRKKPIPHIPESIGVITSPSGAVIHDILHRLADRFPRRVLVWPVAVQGPGAAEQIVVAIEGFNRLEETGAIGRPSVLIVARGGGSLEDLMAFNEEAVIRAVAASHIPVISAVGHETDTTLIDFVSDLRAPTPTAAAEFAVPVRAELAMRVSQSAGRLDQALLQMRDGRRQHLGMLARGLPDPRRLMEAANQVFDDRSERLCQVITAYVRAQMLHLGRSAAALKDPKTQLAGARHRVALSEQHLHRAAYNTVHNRTLALARRDVPHPQVTITAARQSLLHLAGRSGKPVLVRRLAQSRDRAEALGRTLETLSYRRTLERGFVVVRDGDGHAVSKVKTLKSRQRVMLEFADTMISANIQEF